MYSSYDHCRQQLHGVEAIDYYLADSLYGHIQAGNAPLLFHSIMLLSALLRDGHGCLKLRAEAGQWHWRDEEGKGGYHFPSFAKWRDALQEAALAPRNEKPLVLDCERLYLRRYWTFETGVAHSLKALMARSSLPDQDLAKEVLEQLFPSVPPGDQQRLAVANAMGARFSVLSGGPGTGKTFTVTKLLAAMQRLRNHRLRIAMVAPTGKAAQRLMESVVAAKAVLQEQGVLTAEELRSIPENAATLHRCLGVMPGQHEFRHHSGNTLPLDLLLVDEASMIDLPMMYRLLQALPPGASLVLLGDPDQLPSVSAGSVLADLTPRPHPGYSVEKQRWLRRLTGDAVPVACGKNADYLGLLTDSRRFAGEGGIGRLGAAVIAGEAGKSWAVLKEEMQGLELQEDGDLQTWLDGWVEAYYQPLLQARDVHQAFALLAAFRILCVTRSGPQGAEQVNEYVQARLRHTGLIPVDGKWYPGCPVMVTRNHYELDLFNGDTGLLLRHEGKLRVVFARGDELRYLSPSRLPSLEAVYAMTVHKTQGSEFEQVALLLPERDQPLNTRELLYTGITRAKKSLMIRAGEQIWKKAVRRSVSRYSGLSERL
ncbi:exodeoxyribonuclease V subunit alpha [Thiolapillus sp.]